MTHITPWKDQTPRIIQMTSALFFFFLVIFNGKQQQKRNKENGKEKQTPNALHIVLKGRTKEGFFVVVLWEEIWFGEVQSNTLRLPGGRGCNCTNSSGKEEGKEGRNGMALFQFPKINMTAPVCGVTCLQRHLSHWIPDGSTAGLRVINLASCVGSASMWRHFSTLQHKTPIKKKKT